MIFNIQISNAQTLTPVVRWLEVERTGKGVCWQRIMLSLMRVRRGPNRRSVRPSAACQHKSPHGPSMTMLLGRRGISTSADGVRTATDGSEVFRRFNRRLPGRSYGGLKVLREHLRCPTAEALQNRSGVYGVGAERPYLRDLRWSISCLSRSLLSIPSSTA